MIIVSYPTSPPLHSYPEQTSFVKIEPFCSIMVMIKGDGRIFRKSITSSSPTVILKCWTMNRLLDVTSAVKVPLKV